MQNSQTAKNELWEIPENWSWTTLDQIAEWKSGGTPLSSERKYYGGEIPWLVIGDLNDGLVTSSQQTISKLGLDNSSAKAVKKGSILVAMYGSIGKLGIAGMDCTTNQAIAFASELSNEVVDRFLFYYLMHLRSYLFTQSKGGAQQNISLTVLKQAPFVKPPLDDQIDLVSRVESSLSAAKLSLSKIHRAIMLLEKCRQSIISSAVSGRLTEDWREKNYETSLTSKSIGSDFDSPNYPSSDLPELPDTWVWTTLNSIVDIRGGVTKGRNLSGKKTIRLPYLRVANVQDGYLDLNEIKYIDIKEDEYDKYILKPGDILYTEGGDRDKLGRGTVWNGEIENCIHQNHIFRARPKNGGIDSQYISIATKSQVAKLYLFNNASQTVNLASINSTTLKGTPVALPTLPEQKEIVSRVRLLSELAERSEKQIAEAAKRIDRLTQSILGKAFRGELQR